MRAGPSGSRSSKASALASLSPLIEPHPSLGERQFSPESLLIRVTQALSGMGDLESLLKLILAEGRRMLEARDISLLLIQDSELRARTWLGLETREAQEIRIGRGAGLEWRAVDSERPFVAHQAEREPDFFPMPGRRGAAGAFIAVPMLLRDVAIGVLAASRERPGWFTKRQVHWLSVLGELAAVAIEYERLRAADRQQALVKAREEFLAIVSHELKTPVAVIKAYCDVLRRRGSQPSWKTEDLELLSHIQDQADRMLVMIEELLDVHRLESEQLRMEARRFDMAHSARRVTETMQLTAPEHHLSYQGDSQALVVGDRKRLEQVLTNLLDNAVKYSAPGTEVLVNVAKQDARVLISVADRGIGIAPELKERIFDRFFQARAAPIRGYVGLGLGLFISRQIVERHGGSLWVDSQPGRGSTFYVSLPTRVPAAEQPPGEVAKVTQTVAPTRSLAPIADR